MHPRGKKTNQVHEAATQRNKASLTTSWCNHPRKINGTHGYDKSSSLISYSISKPGFLTTIFA